MTEVRKPGAMANYQACCFFLLEKIEQLVITFYLFSKNASCYPNNLIFFVWTCNGSKFNQLCIEALWTLSFLPRISSSFYPTVSLAYLD